jgi:predicted TIM-barrel fold metal-dependent hydrolase
LVFVENFLRIKVLTDLTVVDIHAHIYPRIYIEILETTNHILKEADGTQIILETGDKSGHKIKLSEQMWNINSRLNVMDTLGIDVQVLSIGNPWLSYLPKSKLKSSARALNSELAAICKGHSKRFVPIGVIPISSIEEAIDEIDYGIDELGMRGFMIGTHIDGKPPYSDEFVPIWEELERKNVPLFIHPLAREEVEKNYDRLVTVGILFPNETTLAAVGFMTRGLLDKLPNLKIVLAHLGGNLPISIGRIDRSVKTNPTKAPLFQKVTEEYIKKFYLDSLSYYKPALELAVDCWGPSKVMLGSDFPWHWSSDPNKIIEPISKSKYSTQDKNLILGENAVKIFKI